MAKSKGRGPYKAGSPVNKRKAQGWFGVQPERELANTGSLNALRSSAVRQARLRMMAAYIPQAGSEGYGYGDISRTEAAKAYALAKKLDAETTDPDAGSSGFAGGTGASYRPPM